MSFVTLLVVANVIAVKPLEFNGWILPAGTIAYPFTFLVTDTISELYGRRIATRVVWLGFGLSVVMVTLVFIARVLPPAGFWENQEAYETILGSVPRVVLGSMFAYLVSQNSDVLVFHHLRRVTSGRHLWLRNNASTMLSQALDTTLFISIAFVGTVPGSVLLNMMLTQYLVKIGIAIVDTPLVYALVRWIRSKPNFAANSREPELIR